ncbi:MAG: nodulation protein NfeD [Microscillaceae bacterium]|jgi:membrane-bound serine protease (ClpP class)|nr:nodulation protein NfeD [Microscillaceae bacterium]
MKTLWYIVTIGLGLLLGLASFSAQAQKSKVFTMQIHGEIDPRMERYVKLAFEEAQKNKVDYVVIDMNTYGGRIDNADAITGQILAFPKPIFVFINPNAGSAGAWISIACDKIYMTSNATIGAATVVNGTGEALPDKYQSYMRGKMRATATANGRNPQIAEAMVDSRVEIAGVNEKGKVLTFTTAEAIKNNYCEGEVKSVAEILAQNQIKNYEKIAFELSPLEQFISIFLNPYLSGILLSIIVAGIFFELKTPGIGFPLIASITAAVLYFIPYYLTGLAENWEIAVFFVGVVLLFIELFVTPGFGVLGFSGLGAIFGALFLMMVNNKGFNFDFVGTSEALTSLTTVLFSLVLTVAMLLYLVPKVLNSKRFSRIALQTSLNSEDGYTASVYSDSLVGKNGIAHTVLRPSGKIMIDNTIYDASTLGDFIEKDSKIIVVRQEGTSLQVKKA